MGFDDFAVAAREGIKGLLLPGRLVVSRAEGESTLLSAFSDCIMLLYGMDGDPREAVDRRVLWERCTPATRLKPDIRSQQKKRKRATASCVSTMK